MKEQNKKRLMQEETRIRTIVNKHKIGRGVPTLRQVQYHIKLSHEKVEANL